MGCFFTFYFIKTDSVGGGETMVALSQNAPKDDSESLNYLRDSFLDSSSDSFILAFRRFKSSQAYFLCV